MNSRPPPKQQKQTRPGPNSKKKNTNPAQTEEKQNTPPPKEKKKHAHPAQTAKTKQKKRPPAQTAKNITLGRVGCLFIFCCLCGCVFHFLLFGRENETRLRPNSKKINIRKAQTTKESRQKKVNTLTDMYSRLPLPPLCRELSG